MRFLVIILILFSSCAKSQVYFGRISGSGSGGGGGSLIGPAITWTGKTTVFLGDSWTNGVAASVSANRYTSLFATGKGTTESNSGLNGVTISPDSCDGYSYYSLAYIPTYSSGTHCALFINLGLNDIGANNSYQTADRFDSAYNAYLNNAINVKSWPDSLVYIFTPGYVIDYTAWGTSCGITTANSARAIAFNAKIEALATTYGCNYVDIYTPMAAALNSSYFDAGKAHLNDTGMDWLADWLLAHIR